jgi:hypothetical protein
VLKLDETLVAYLEEHGPTTLAGLRTANVLGEHALKKVLHRLTLAETIVRHQTQPSAHAQHIWYYMPGQNAPTDTSGPVHVWERVNSRARYCDHCGTTVTVDLRP